MDASRFHAHAHGSTPLSFTGERIVPGEPGWEWCFEAHRFGYEVLAERIPSGARILDIGCGEGYGTARLATLGSFTVGCDYAFDAVSHAARRYAREGLAFVVCDAQRLPLRSSSFDVVASLQVIEHFTDTHAHLTDVARMLRDGGFHLCATPNIALATAEEAANEWHLRDFTADQLEAAMRAAFDEVELLGQFYVESSPRVRAMRAADAASAGAGAKRARLERILSRLPGPVRVRARPFLRRLFGIPAVDADAIRNQITADDFELRAPAEESFCLFAIARRPRR
jgi:ubiquinone/menaquinone biosynthesis C-methylase UbiE